MSNAQQEEIEIQRADKEASQALVATIQAQRDALLAAAKAALEHFGLESASNSYYGTHTEVVAQLCKAIRLAESD